MTLLPKHGRVDCIRCHNCSDIGFDEQKTGDDNWRITHNPLSWGNDAPEVILLGFSKGPTQAGALAHEPHNSIAYRGSRLNVGKILARVGLIPKHEHRELKSIVDAMIGDCSGRFHFASLVRCTVERFDPKSQSWKGSGGGMLDKFVSTEFGSLVASNCAHRFLARLPARTRLVVMFGLGTKLNYVSAAKSLISSARQGPWRWINKVAYTDEKIVVVHVEHFAAQGALIPNWLGDNHHPRSEYGQLAHEAVLGAIGKEDGPASGH